jgi:hypothetical protein
MTTFDDREKAFEAKFRLDQDLDFKVRMRRDRLLGLWAAEMLGLEDPAAYARSVVEAEFDRPDHDAALKVAQDLAARGVTVSEDEIRLRLDAFSAQARAEINAEPLA